VKASHMYWRTFGRAWSRPYCEDMTLIRSIGKQNPGRAYWRMMARQKGLL